MAIISNLYMFQLAVSSNFAFIFVDPEKQTNSELINSTRLMFVSLSVFSVVMAVVAVFFFKKSSSSLLMQKKDIQSERRNETEVTMLTTKQNSSTKVLSKEEDERVQQKIEEIQEAQNEETDEQEEERLSSSQQLLGVIKDPAFVLISSASIFMGAVAQIYTNNLNAMAATYGFLEVKNSLKRGKNSLVFGLILF